jgi:hypothetical protein
MDDVLKAYSLTPKVSPKGGAQSAHINRQAAHWSVGFILSDELAKVL